MTCHSYTEYINNKIEKNNNCEDIFHVPILLLDSGVVKGYYWGMRFQLIITEDLKFDLDNYCKENSLKPSDLVRSLIRDEVYYSQKFCKPQNFNPKKHDKKATR